MQVADAKLANDFASGGSLETNVLQLNATPRIHSEYQVICEEGKCAAEQSRRGRKKSLGFDGSADCTAEPEI